MKRGFRAHEWQERKTFTLWRMLEKLGSSSSDNALAICGWDCKGGKTAPALWDGMGRMMLLPSLFSSTPDIV